MTGDAEPFALVVRFTVRPEATAAFDALVAHTAVGIREREPGTLVYACHRVQGQPRQRIFYEMYRNQAAFEAHESQPHTRRFLAEREQMLESTEVDFLSRPEGKVPIRIFLASNDA